MLHHIVIGHLEHLGGVDLYQIVERVLHTRNAHPVASARKAAACQLFCVPAFNKAVDKAVVAGKARPARFVFEQIFHALADQLFVGIVVHPHRQVAGNVDPVGGVQNQVTDARGHVLAAFIRPAKLVIAGIVQKQAGDIEFRLLFGDPARRHVGLEERAQQLIQLAAGGAAVVKAGEKAEPAHPLNSLPHGRRALVADFQIDLRHFLQILFQVRVALLLRQGLNLARHPLQERDDALHDLFLAVVEFPAFRRGVFSAAFFELFQNAAPAQLQTHLDIRRKMPVAADAADDVVLAEFLFQLRIGVIRVPNLALGAGHEKEASADECVQRIAVQRVLVQNMGIVERPALVAVKRAVFMGGHKIKMDILRGNHTPVIVLVQPSFAVYFLLCLAELALFQQADALIICEHFFFGKFIDELNL